MQRNERVKNIIYINSPIPDKGFHILKFLLILFIIKILSESRIGFFVSKSPTNYLNYLPI